MVDAAGSAGASGTGSLAAPPPALGSTFAAAAAASSVTSKAGAGTCGMSPDASEDLSLPAGAVSAGTGGGRGIGDFRFSEQNLGLRFCLAAEGVIDRHVLVEGLHAALIGRTHFLRPLHCGHNRQIRIGDDRSARPGSISINSGTKMAKPLTAAMPIQSSGRVRPGPSGKAADPGAAAGRGVAGARRNLRAADRRHRRPGREKAAAPGCSRQAGLRPSQPATAAVRIRSWL